MRSLTAAFALLLTSCDSMPWTRGPEVSGPACTAACDAHFTQCQEVLFAGFPERGAIECPAEHNRCLQVCADRHPDVRTGVTVSAAGPEKMPTSVTSAVCAPAATSREDRLRELKHLYDEALVTDDVYRDRQKAILSQP
jgi:hypothetical protein